MQPWSRSVTMAFLFVGATPPLAFSQSTSITNMTSAPVPGVGHDYIHDLDEIVNPANGSLSIRIEAPKPKERGLNFPLYAFVYDSDTQYVTQMKEYTDSGPQCWFSGETGPAICTYHVDAPQLVTPVGVTVNTGPNTLASQQQSWTYYYSASQSATCSLNTDYVYEDPYGVRHPLGIVTSNGSSGSACSSTFHINLSPIGGDEQYKAMFSDAVAGTTFNRIIDLHGNSSDLSTVGISQLLQFEDTNGNYPNGTGRPGSYDSFPGATPHSPSQSYSITFPGNHTYTYNPTAQPIVTTYRLKSTDITPGGDNFCGGGSPENNPAPGVDSIQQPDLLSYQFLYDSTYGMINKITYPTGAYVQYTWGVNSDSEMTGYGGASQYTDPLVPGINGNTFCYFRHDFPAITARTVSYDGVTPAKTETFYYTPTTWSPDNPQDWTKKQTIVTTTDLLSPGTPSFTTEYNYKPMKVLESTFSHTVHSSIPVEDTIVYKDSSGIVLRTVTKTWNTPNQMAAECTMLPNGNTSGIFYTYAPYAFPVSAAAYSGYTDLVTDKAEYDYGLVTSSCAKPSGTPSRETVTAYASSTNTPLWPAFPYGGYLQTPQSKPDRPQSIKLYDHGSLIAETDYNYDEPTHPPVGLTSDPYGHDKPNFNVGVTNSRGNPTTIIRRCFQAGSCADSVTAIDYDITGQPVTVKDANNYTTSLSYGDNYTSDDGSPSNGVNTNTYLTSISRPFVNVAHTESFSYDYYKGEVRQVTDENLNVFSYEYNDPWDRLTLSKASIPNTGAQTTYTYSDAGPYPSITTKTVLSAGKPTRDSITIMDGFGHVIHNNLTSDPQGADFVDMSYDGLGRVSSVSNPYRSSTGTHYYTTYQYDALGRLRTQTQPDTSTLQYCYENIPNPGQPSTACSANRSSQTTGDWVDTLDETGRHRQRVMDAWGRLTAVMEPDSSNSPTMETDYQYNALGNLLRVDQWGGAVNTPGKRVRRFSYDSLSQLIAANNPENYTSLYPASLTCPGASTTDGLWTTCYRYDANGNLTSKTDNRGVTTNLSYDGLNRLYYKSYQNDPSGTSAVNYGYDVAWPQNPAPGWNFLDQTFPSYQGVSQINLTGRLSTEGRADFKSATVYSYDNMGEITVKSTCTPVFCGTDHYDLHYEYDLAGNLTRYDRGLDAFNNYTYPNQGYYFGGHYITYDAAGHVILMTADVLGGTPQTIFSNAQYDFAGHLTGARTDSVYNQTWTYSNRGWWSDETTKDLNSNVLWTGHAGSAPNGNVVSTRDTLAGNWTYTYDNTNNLKTATGPQQSILWRYDAFGNRTLQQATVGSAPYSAPNYNSNNQILTGYGYDAMGNMTNDGFHTYTYDAENRVATVDGSVSYIYDAQGDRVAAMSGGAQLKSWLFDPQHRQMTEIGPDYKMTSGAVYLGDMYMAEYTHGSYPGGTGGNLNLRITDQVGNLRSLWNQAGNMQEQCSTLPFGDVFSCAGPLGGSTSNHLFTGKERDSESNLDYFGARYYSSTLGRFLSADWASKPEAVPYSDLSNPQSLNLYTYVKNNPLSIADPNGHCCWDEVSGAVAGFLNTVPDTINLINGATNAAISTFTSYRFAELQRIEADNPAMQIGMDAGTALSFAAPVGDMAEAAQVLRNASQGRAFQDAVAAEKALTDTNVVQNITIKTESGVRTVMDVVSKDASGNTALTEAKSSAAAKLTPNQAVAHPEIAQTGGTVVGKGKTGFPGGTRIPPTKVEVVRPEPHL